MKLIIFILAVVLSSGALGAVQGILTPSPVQSGFPGNCAGFAMAIPGDTCESLAQKNGLGVDALLNLNPQIGGPLNCPQNLYANYWYCMHTDGPRPPPFGGQFPPPGADVPPPPPAPAPTVNPGHPVAQPPAVTIAPQKPTTLATVTTPPPSCATNDCWRAFRKAADRVKPSYSSWCTSVLQGPAILESNFDAFPGAPNMVRNQCSTLGDAHTVISSYCRCYTAGKI